MDSLELRVHPATWDCPDRLDLKDYAVNPDHADEAEPMALPDPQDRLGHRALVASLARMAKMDGQVWLDHRDPLVPVPRSTQPLYTPC